MKRKYAESARCINAEDINKITGYNPNAVGVKNPTAEQIASGTKYGQGDNNPFQYGREVTYSWSGNTDKNPLYMYFGKTMPSNLTQVHNAFHWFDGKEWNTSGYEVGKTGEICKLTSNYYYYYPTTLTSSSSGDVVGIAIDSDEYKLLFDKTNFGNGNNEYYWLASRYVDTHLNCVRFTIAFVASGYMTGCRLAYSDGLISRYGFGLRPIVTLNPDIKLQPNGENAWKFVD